jgi:hypothetical protein
MTTVELKDTIQRQAAFHSFNRTTGTPSRHLAEQNQGKTLAKVLPDLRGWREMRDSTRHTARGNITKLALRIGGLYAVRLLFTSVLNASLRWSEHRSWIT